MTDLRRRLRKANVEYVVIKNTLALRAVNESGLVGERLRGPTGLVVAKDPVAAAKVLTDFAKENDQKPAVKGGLFEGDAIDKAQVKQAGLDAVARADARRARRRAAVAAGRRSSARSAACCTCSPVRSRRCARSARAPERALKVGQSTDREFAVTDRVND